MSKEHLTSMKKISKYYCAGFALSFGYHLGKIEDATPGFYVINIPIKD